MEWQNGKEREAMDGDREITNSEDVIASREIIARIAFLERWDCGALDGDQGCDDTDCKSCYGDMADEFKALMALADQGIAEWADGATLIRDSYFETYAEQLAEDLGVISSEASEWPLNHIDWEAAAEDLRIDYMSFEFDGVTYWARA
jgi:hypothetical protein